jgi:hypothetical protein
MYNGQWMQDIEKTHMQIGQFEKKVEKEKSHW